MHKVCCAISVIALMVGTLGAVQATIGSVDIQSVPTDKHKVTLINLKSDGVNPLPKPNVASREGQTVVKFSNVVYRAIGDSNRQSVRSDIGDIVLLQKGVDLYMVMRGNNLKVDFIQESNAVKVSKLDVMDSMLNAQASVSRVGVMDRNHELNMGKYMALVGCMAAVLAVLLAVKKKVNERRKVSDIYFRQAKIMDSRNKIVVVDYKDKSYLLGLNPNGVTLIDKIRKSDDGKENNGKKQELGNKYDFKNLLKQKDVGS